MHGASAAQVRNKAMQRLRALVHPAIDALATRIYDDDNPALALAAARYVLDWAGFKSPVRVQQDGHVICEIEFVKVPLPKPLPAESWR
jgi:hypothetical protein